MVSKVENGAMSHAHPQGRYEITLRRCCLLSGLPCLRAAPVCSNTKSERRSHWVPNLLVSSSPKVAFQVLFPFKVHLCGELSGHSVHARALCLLSFLDSVGSPPFTSHEPSAQLSQSSFYNKKNSEKLISTKLLIT